MTEWQPMNTAPRDGSEVDLWVCSQYTGIKFRRPECRWRYDDWIFSTGKLSLSDVGWTPLFWIRPPPPPTVDKSHGLVYPCRATTGYSDEP